MASVNYDGSTYSESAEGVMIDERRVRIELATHGFTSDEDLNECLGEIEQHVTYDYPANGGQVRKVRYNAADVLTWLGY